MIWCAFTLTLYSAPPNNGAALTCRWNCCALALTLPDSQRDSDLLVDPLTWRPGEPVIYLRNCY